MGLNIIAYRVLSVERESAYNTNHTWINSERYHGFNTARFTGDKDFAVEVDWIPHPDDPERDHYRPKDFQAAKQWVRNNIYPSNQERLLNLLDAMKKDPDLYVCFSW